MRLLPAMMALIFSSAAALAAPVLPSAMRCTGLERELDLSGEIKTTQVVLAPIAGQEASGVLQAILGDHAFSVTPAGEAQDYLLNIAIGPDYTQGSIATTTFTSDGRMQLSTVDGATVYKLECTR